MGAKNIARLRYREGSGMRWYLVIDRKGNRLPKQILASSPRLAAEEYRDMYRLRKPDLAVVRLEQLQIFQGPDLEEYGFTLEFAS